jgi:hypothetical protein
MASCPDPVSGRASFEKNASYRIPQVPTRATCTKRTPCECEAQELSKSRLWADLFCPKKYYRYWKKKFLDYTGTSPSIANLHLIPDHINFVSVEWAFACVTIITTAIALRKRTKENDILCCNGWKYFLNAKVTPQRRKARCSWSPRANTSTHNGKEWPCCNGVDFLLSRNKTLLKRKDKYGRTDLWISTYSSHDSVTIRLLEESDVDVNTLGKDSRCDHPSTSLHHLAIRIDTTTLRKFLAMPSLYPISALALNLRSTWL